MVVLVVVIVGCGAAGGRGLQPQRVGAERAARCITVGFGNGTGCIRFRDQSFCVVEEIGLAAAGVLTQSSAERVVAVGRDQGVGVVSYFDQPVVGVVHVVSCVGCVDAVGLAARVAVVVVSVGDAIGSDELVVCVIDPSGRGAVVGEAVGELIVAVGFVRLRCGLTGVGRRRQSIQRVVAVAGGARFGDFGCYVVGGVVAVLVVQHLALAGILDAEVLESQQAVVVLRAHRAAGQGDLAGHSPLVAVEGDAAKPCGQVDGTELVVGVVGVAVACTIRIGEVALLA